MLSMQEVSDRFELQDLVFRYSQIIDSKDFDLLREEVFTEDAFIDYSAFGGSKGQLEETIEFLHKAMAIFPNTQHLNANIQIRLDASDPDKASGRVMCFNPQDMQIEGGEHHIFFCGLWYIDEYRRTEKGWRICRRLEEKSYVFNAPDFMKL
jgi:SnoaL-like domain